MEDTAIQELSEPVLQNKTFEGKSPRNFNTQGEKPTYQNSNIKKYRNDMVAKISLQVVQEEEEEEEQKDNHEHDDDDNDDILFSENRMRNDRDSVQIIDNNGVIHHERY